MRLVSSTLLSVILALSMFSVGAVVDRVSNVYVTNLPLDTQGNLKVSPNSADPSWKTIRIVENFTLTWTPNWAEAHSDLIDTGLVETGGYSRMKLYVQVTDYTLMNQGAANYAYVRVALASRYDFAETPIHTNVYANWYSYTAPGQKLLSFYPSSYETYSTSGQSLRIFIQGVSNTPSGPLPQTISCLVSVGIYLRNE